MPYLKLKIVSGSETGQNDNYSFTPLGGSIGRSEDCDWTLLDSDRFVSKKHLVISYRNQQFILTDVSSNGVIINGAATPLGRGNEHILQTIDSLVIGKHVVKVEEVNVDSDNLNPFQSPSSDSDLLGLVLGTNTTSEPIHNPIHKPNQETNQTPMQDPLAAFNVPESLELFTQTKQESELGLEGILSASVKSPAANEFSNFNDQSNPFNISAAPVASASQVNVTPQSDAIIAKVTADDSLIPDDWDIFDTKSAADKVELPFEANIPMTPVHSGENVDANLHNDILPPSDIHIQAAESLPEEPSSIFDAQPLAISDNHHVQDVQSTPPLAMPTVQKTSSQHSDNAHLSGSVEEPVKTTNDDFFTALYDKLGLSKEFKASIDQETFAEDIATILLSTTQGLMSLLASRTAFKQESRLSSTLIQAKSNNPIKFSIDPVDTLEMLLVKKKKGYMSVGNSYDEAMEDIQLHQMAFMSGLQGSLDGVLAQLAPEDIEKQVSKKSQRFLGLNSNSQCWQIYKEKQPLLAKSVKENLNEVLGTYFSEAYQSQINRFKNEK
ncbi:MAG: type VI secretion system-associated FHA domain protein TagH [Paraglaciecola sp.]|nr:type VI secretion system-associated FHA domain protein TagH [Paraglaciecola sp.]